MKRDRSRERSRFNTSPHPIRHQGSRSMCGRPLKGKKNRPGAYRCLACSRSCVRPVGAASWPLAQMGSANRSSTGSRPPRAVGPHGMSRSPARPVIIFSKAIFPPPAPARGQARCVQQVKGNAMSTSKPTRICGSRSRRPVRSRPQKTAKATSFPSAQSFHFVSPSPSGTSCYSPLLPGSPAIR